MKYRFKIYKIELKRGIFTRNYFGSKVHFLHQNLHKYQNLQKFVIEIFEVKVGLSTELINNIFEFIEKPHFLRINSQFKPEDPNDKI